MFIVDDLVSYFANSGIQKGARLYEEYKLDKYIEEIKEEIVCNINKKYETEPFFDSFSNFYESNKITEKILDRIFDRNNEESVDSMLDLLSEKFVEQYKMYSVYKARIKEILNGIYQSIFKGLNVSGVLSEEQITQLISTKYARKQLESISEVKRMMQDFQGEMGELRKLMKELSPNDNELPISHSFSVVSEAGENVTNNSEYAEKLKSIEKEMQEEYNFHGAIETYKNLLTDLFEAPCHDETLFSDIYINIALCHANLGEYSEAKRNIQLAKKHTKTDNNSKLHYVNGYILWKENNQENATLIREELNRALEINPQYVSAKMLLCIIEAVMKNDITYILQKLEELEQEAPEDRLGEVLQTIGLVYRLYGQFEKAEEYVLRADSIKKDISNTANLGLIYYSWATQNNVSDKRQLKINIDYPKMFKAIHYLKEVVQDNSRAATAYKQEVLELYISASMLCDEYDLIDDVSTVDVRTLDYEAARTLIFHRIRKGDKDAVELLQQEDKEFHDIVSLAEEGEEGALTLVVDKIKHVSETELFRYYNLGLRLALNTNNLGTYRKLRKEVTTRNIDCPYLELYDAEYNAITGQEKKAKAYFDAIIYEICDDYILVPAIKFYKDRNCETELSILYEETIKKLHDRKITCHNVQALVGESFSFLIEKDFNKAMRLFEILNPGIVGTEIYNGIKNNLFYRIMDVEKVLEANRELQKTHPSIELQINEILLLKLDMQFAEALDKASRILEIQDLSQKQRIMVLELLSECALFDENFDKSVEYISQAKDLAKELVYDPVHPMYMTRLLRCGNHEGLKYGIEFQQTHPNITDWIHPVTINADPDSGDNALADELVEFLSKQKEQIQLKIDFYKENKISFYQFMHITKENMLNALSYPECYGTKVFIGMGNNEEIQKQEEQIGTTVVIDAFTLVFLELYHISEVLDVFKKIYVTYSTVEEIEKLFLQYDNEIIGRTFRRIRDDLRFERCPDYSNYSEEIMLYHPKYFFDALELAKRKKTKFLCFDAMAALIFADGKEYMVGIIPVIQKMKNAGNDDLPSKMIYNLIGKNLTFVNFNAMDIVYALKQSDEHVEQKLNAFMKIDKNCDVDSFARVYLHTVRILLVSEEQKLVIFLDKLLQMVDRVYNWARMEKWRYGEYNNEQCMKNYYLYSCFVVILIAGLIVMFGHVERIYIPLYKRNYKYIPKKFIETIHEKIKEGKHFPEDIIDELTDAI